jgi:hypothetical protein
MADWSREFDVPIVLHNGKKLLTLDDGRQHLLKIPKSKYTEAIGAAAEALVMAAEHRGPMMHANVGVARVVYGPKKIPEPQPSTETRWARRKLARDK